MSPKRYKATDRLLLEEIEDLKSYLKDDPGGLRRLEFIESLYYNIKRLPRPEDAVVLPPEGE